MLYTEIYSGVWIGDVDIMYSNKFLEDNFITIIINCTVTRKFPDNSNTQNIRIPLTNNLYQSIHVLKQNKQKILSFIDRAIETDNILIICEDGIIASPFIISLYLVNYGGIDVGNIRSIIQSKNQAISMDFDIGLLDL